jgi:hypothetical protein
MSKLDLPIISFQEQIEVLSLERWSAGQTLFHLAAWRIKVCLTDISHIEQSTKSSPAILLLEGGRDLPSKHKGLSSNPSTAKKKKKVLCQTLLLHL